MNAVCETDLKSPEQLCAWLNDGTTPNDLKPETTRPWAETYRVDGPSKTRFLKVLPEVQTAALSALPVLSKLFPHVVPAVQAVDPARGLLLLEHHGGVDQKRDLSLEQEQAILVTYAKLQAEASRQPELLNRLPAIALDDLVPNLLTFLNPDFTGTAPSGPATAKEFFDTERCKYYFELFEARAQKLAELIRAARQLPTTINHCDLRSRNTAVRDNGDLVIYDWDEAVAGPAGMSLHNYFSGCSTPCEMLLDPATAMWSDRAADRVLLSSYVNTLVAHGYSDARRLNQALAGSICAGVINYLLSYGKFLPPDDEYREVVGGILRKRTNDLLLLADILYSSSREATLRMVADYESREREDHATRILARYVLREPWDTEAFAKLADLLPADDTDEVPKIYGRLLERHPDNGVVHRFYGLWRLDELDFDVALVHLTMAQQLGEVDDALATAICDAKEYRDVCRKATLPGEMPTIRVSAEEAAAGKMKRVRRRLGVELFRMYGTLLIENAFPEQLVEQMHVEYLDRYQRYFVNERHSDALKVGNSRFMVTVDVAGAYNSPTVYANPNVAPIIEEILGENMIMGGFVSVASLPGADPMRVHKDHPALFRESDYKDKLPYFAVTAIVPLRGFNHELGTTRVWKGSHLCSSAQAEEMDYQDPSAPRGACMLMDYRLTHQGLGNRSQEVRPILTMIYHRPWFRDIVNYGIQDPLLMSDEAFAKVPEEHRKLFAWARPRDKQDCPAAARNSPMGN